MTVSSILIVEDEAIVAADLASSLRRLGHTVCGTAASGAGAIALVRDQHPDLVLMDIHLAGPMDGIAAAETTRAQYDVPVVYLTAHADAGTLERAETTEPFGYILKPFDERDLRTHIEIARFRHRIDRELRDSRAELNRAQSVARVGSWRLDTRTNELRWSEETSRIFGLPGGMPPTYEGFLRAVHPEDRGLVDASWKAALRGAPYDVEHRVVVGDAVRWVRERATLDFDAQGEARGALGTTQDVTDAKAAQEALREAHARALWLARFPEENPEPVVRVAVDGRVLYANNAATETTTWLRDGGKTLVPPLRRLIARAVSERASIEQDVEVGGQTYAISVVRFPEAQYLNLYGLDVTDDRRREEELKAMQRKEQDDAVRLARGQSAVATISAMREGVVLLELDGTITSVNPAVERTLGLSREDVVGRDIKTILPDLLGDGELRRSRRGLESLVHGGIPQFPALRLQRPGGQVSYILPSASLMDAPEGDRRVAVLTLRDVSDLHKASERVRQSERKYRELVENANSIIMRVTPEHTITFFNEYAQRFFGYTLDEVLGRPVIGTLVPEVDSEGRDLREVLRSITATTELHAANENENVCKDGRRVWVHWSNRAIRDGRGQLVEILCVGTDIARRREMEAEALRYQARLRELAERLVAAEEEDRWRISRNIHDTIIQTLSLSSIRLASMAEPLAGVQLHEEANRLRDVRTLLDQAINECRRVMSDLTPALLYELGLVPALRELAQTLEAKHGVKVAVDDHEPEQRLPNPLRGLLFESARELVMNALKYAGPCDIRVALSRHDSGLAISVADNGKGFDPAAGTPRDRKGGFGLFSIRQRLEGLGGKLEIQSAPGRGTTATITVPIEEGQ
jgi:PAS domain S-box-containing protein